MPTCDSVIMSILNTLIKFAKILTADLSLKYCKQNFNNDML